ncbi:MAG: polysaccharide biosynthesis protein [Deltaproteobacteria bacterium]|nr:polysaccharide biosynthesis protein [Deltaproteobacteria bacterium]
MKKTLVFVTDVHLIALAFVLSCLFRFDFFLAESMRSQFWEALCLMLLVKPLVFLTVGFYRNLWCYASARDAINILKTVTVACILSAALLVFATNPASLPRSILALDWLILLFLIGASRLVPRFRRELQSPSANQARPRALIIGAGEAGSLLLKEIRRQANPAYLITGFIDDDPAKLGMYLHGVPVMGTLAHVRELVVKHAVEAAIIAIPSANGPVTRYIVGTCRTAGVRVRTVPAMGDIMTGRIAISEIRDVEIEHLLGREPVILDEVGIGDFLFGRKVLVSGAAGSIGSELCRQVARFGPGRLILLDNAETPLFNIHRELISAYPDLNIDAIVGDVKNRRKVRAVFADFLPEVVFHSAAYKHVPLMECNMAEAVTNNIGGTLAMADAADSFGVTDFVMISTDKAVNPANVMGASKRVAEIYVQALAANSRTKFATVRFGNVLGSNGSVIPIFMEQIRKGGPVTVTDPEITRYFMTIPEATQLVLQAGCIGKGGEIFVLDMGDPVRIADLAEELIRLSGFIPHQDIDITFTGLRPGEKLFEELLAGGEGILPTAHKKIRVLASTETDVVALHSEVQRLLGFADQLNIPGMMRSLRSLVPEFQNGTEIAGTLPSRFNRARLSHAPRERVAGQSKARLR